MPEIGRIQSTNFQALLTQLGITRNNIPFALRSEVTPVVLVGGTVSFLASPTPPYRVQDFFTAGVQTAPAINTVLADTGPLPIGAYSVQMALFALEVNTFEFQMRNAANSANLMGQRWRNDVGLELSLFEIRLQVENDNERIRVLNIVAGNVGIDYQVSLWARI